MFSFNLKSLIAVSFLLVGIVVLVGALGRVRMLDVSLPNPFRDAYLNRTVLRLLPQYEARDLSPMDASASATAMGVSREIFYQGRRVARPTATNEVYCVGLTFDVFMAACERRGGSNFRLRGLSSTNFGDFRQDWYGVGGNERTKVHALVSRNLGREITNRDDARPGDFVQFWRGSTGHSVIFLAWVVDEQDTVIGIQYWSVGSRSGVGKNFELFREAGGSVDPDRVYIVRAFAP